MRENVAWYDRHQYKTHCIFIFLCSQFCHFLFDLDVVYLLFSFLVMFRVFFGCIEKKKQKYVRIIKIKMPFSLHIWAMVKQSE